MLKKYYSLSVALTCLIALLNITLSHAQAVQNSLTIRFSGGITQVSSTITSLTCTGAPFFVNLEAGFSDKPTGCPGGSLSPASSFLIDVAVGCTDISDYTYVVELSDATGNFSNPTILAETGSPSNISGLLLGEPSFSLPATLPAGMNYLIRLRLKNLAVFSPAVGPYSIGSFSPQITSLVADETGCPIKIQAQNQGNALVLTGPNGYVFSYAYRQYGTNAVVFTPSVAGAYTLTSYSSFTNLSCPGATQSVQQTVQINRNCP